MAKAANGTLPSMPEKQPRFMDRFSKATKVGFVLLGYFLGIIGVDRLGYRPQEKDDGM